MSTLCSKIPAILVERIESSHPARAHFLMTELEGWPEGVVSKLARCGLFQVSDHAEAIVCPGCDWQCHKRILARKTDAGQLRAYIVCDEEPAHGLIFVTDHDRARYHTSLSRLARLIADLLGQEAPKASASGAVFRLGTVDGRHGTPEVCLALDDGRLRLRVGQHSLPLVDVLFWKSDGLAIDNKRVCQFAGRKISERGSAKESVRSDCTRQQQRSHATATNRAIFLEATRRPARVIRHTTRIELALDEDRGQVVVDGLGNVGTNAHFEIIAVLAEQYRADLKAELKPVNYAFVAAGRLMDRLGIESEPALRKRVSGFRKRVAALALRKWGLPLSRTEVIENKSRSGYRLNPAVQIIDPKQLG